MDININMDMEIEIEIDGTAMEEFLGDARDVAQTTHIYICIMKKG